MVGTAGDQESQYLRSVLGHRLSMLIDWRKAERGAREHLLDITVIDARTGDVECNVQGHTNIERCLAGNQ